MSAEDRPVSVVWLAGAAAKEVFDAAMKSLPSHAVDLANRAAEMAYENVLNAPASLLCAVCDEPINADEETHWQGEDLAEVHADCCTDCAAES
jgi:hypothetical protein